MKNLFTIFDKAWKLPVLILAIGMITIMGSVITTGYYTYGSFSGESMITLHEGNVAIQFFEIVFLIIFLSTWLISIPVSHRYNHTQSLIANQQDTLQGLARFTEKIGNGLYDDESEHLVDNEIGSILFNLREKLRINAEKDRDEKWIANGRDLIGGILRENIEIEAVANRVLEAIVDYTKVVQGAIYISQGTEGDLTLNMMSCYAYSRRKFLDKQFRLGEGLVGQAAIEKDIIHRTEIPDHYLSIKSGLLGDQKPKALLIIPLMVDDNLEGALELAAFSKFSDLEIKFFQDLSVMIARTVFNLKTKERTEKLLKESTQLMKELQYKQKQLEEHAIDLSAKKTQIEESNTKLEEKIQEVENSHKRQHALLENASEIITIFDRQMNILYESPSVKNILGYLPEEVSQNSILDKLDAESRLTFRRMFNEVIVNPDKKFLFEFSYRKKGGERVWMEGIFKNMLLEPAINGIIFNHRDITQRKVAEQEQIMRGKMQALSENSQDIIVRFDLSGQVMYANPMVEKYLLIDKKECIGKPFQLLNIDNSIKSFWKTMLQEITESGKIMEKEMEFPSSNTIRFMSVNVIPEYNQNQVLESVLVVSHDITERKKSEELVKESNRKITESINYAKRIQTSIIPAFEELKNSVKDAFLWYQPKDVVSGDFPWVFKNGDDLYFASVDCTGHGVPGAMMSLIGYLLLNDISKKKGIKPSVILDQLHRDVVRTLKQDVEGNSSSDGMDIALCCYHKKTNILEFSGAHRPLYHLRNHGELDQIKGDKFPIGGNHYDIEQFTNHTIQLSEGDRIYIFSDGLTDQFGGPQQMKYGQKRVREKLIEFGNQTMDFQVRSLKNDFNEWMKDQKQIDDILIIGMKF